MRQLTIQVPRGTGRVVLEAAQRHGGVDLSMLEAQGPDRPLDLVLIHIPNRRLEPLIDELEPVAGLRIAFTPHSVLALQPPLDQAAQRVVDVTTRSPLEVVLGGLQSVGSWTGFLSYAAAAGVVVWVGLYTNTVYLLIAAMLIAPFAGPAMNAAMATARGDATLLGQSLWRYIASLALTITVSGALSLLFQQQVATHLMVQISQISSAAVLLPLVAGAAGALTLVQSERNSLISGAAVGLLVAASLSPPAGLIGMAGVISDWTMAISGVFLLALQLVGINLAGAAVFRLHGLKPRGAHYRAGRPWVVRVTVAASLAALAALLTWQMWDRPALQRSSETERVLEQINDAVEQSGIAALAEANVRFTRADVEGQHTLLGVLYVQPTNGDLSDHDIKQRLTASIHSRLGREHENVLPLIDITVLHPPDHGASVAVQR